MKAVIRNLALNTYGAPTVFMMNLKRVCHTKEPSSSAEISSRTAGFSCNLNKTRSAGFKGLIAVSMHIAAKNTMIATSYPSTRFSVSVSRWCESKGLSTLLRHPVYGSLGDLMRLVLLGLAALQNKRLSQQSTATGVDNSQWLSSDRSRTHGTMYLAYKVTI